MIWSDGTYYIGIYDKDKRDGFGTEFNPDRSVFHHGIWSNSSPIKK
jgi:hypothetical protein